MYRDNFIFTFTVRCNIFYLNCITRLQFGILQFIQRLMWFPARYFTLCSEMSVVQEHRELNHICPGYNPAQEATKQTDVAVKLYACIREVPGSNIARVSGYPTLFCGFTQPSQ
jgi:hypothetical protein